MTPEDIARLFHETYERLAPQFGYETRKESAVAWSDVPAANRKLMIAVAGVVSARLAEEQKLLPIPAQVEAMHSKIRAFIENEAWQGFKVTLITGYLETQYAPTLASRDEISPTHAEYITCEVKARFSVDAVHPANKRRISCHVDITSDGKL